MKVVINRKYGGWSLSPEAQAELGIKRDIPLQYAKMLEDCGDWELEKCGLSRHDPRVVEVVERLGERASGKYADLKVVEIPDGIDYEIDDYDGMETIRESHRTWC